MVVEKVELEEKSEYCQLTARLRREWAPGEENDLWLRFTPRLLLDMIRRRFRSAPAARPMGEEYWRT